MQCRRIRVNVVPDSENEVHLFFPPVPFETALWADPDMSPFTYGGIMQRTGDQEAGLRYSTIASLDTPPDGPCRVVGMGWEVINTTPEMYKSGSLLVYQCPQTASAAGFV